MAVSSPGIGSGLDVNSIVTQLVAIERQPITLLQQQATTVQSKLSVYGQLQSKLSALRDASAALSQSGTWGQTLGRSSDPTSVKCAATMAPPAPRGTDGSKCSAAMVSRSGPARASR